MDQYDDQIFENNNTNLGIVYRNYNDPQREVELIKIAKACKKKRCSAGRSLFSAHGLRNCFVFLIFYLFIKKGATL